MEVPRGDADLEFPRHKRRSLLRSAAYRSQPILRKLIGRDRTLRFLLHTERTAWRLAYETASARFGDEFDNSVRAFTADCAARWLGRDARVLDIGCGHGRIERLIADNVHSVLGVDHDASHVQLARAANHSPNVRFEVGDAEDLPAGEYDVALLIHVLEHIDDTDALLGRIKRLTPRLIVEVPTFESQALNPLRRQLGLDFSSDDDHVREYTQPLLEAHLLRAGWRVADWEWGSCSLAALAER